MRLQLKIVLSFLIVGMALSCSTPNLIGYEQTGEVICTNHDNRKATFATKAKGGTGAEAIFNASAKTFENLFYKGVPDSSQEVALVPSDKRTDSNRNMLSEFLSSGTYKQYVLSNSTIQEIESNGIFYVDQRIDIDMGALRKYLEDNQIIKKFGI